MDLDMLRQRIQSFFTTDGKAKSRHLILFLGLLGMLLIGLSECTAGTAADTGDMVSPAETFSSARSAAQELEQRLLQVLEQMEGVGRAEIMITMEDSGESYYATEDKTDGDSESIYADNGTLSSIRSQRSAEQEYLLVENSDGDRQALLLSHSEPQVKGVIVICDGADQAAVRQAVTEAVSTVLNISTNRVYVAKAKAEK